MKKKHFGSDFDIDTQRITKVINKAYIVYWDRNYTIIQKSIIYSETVFPITIFKALQALAPKNAVGCIITFKLNVIAF